MRRSVHDLTAGLRAAGVPVSYLDTGSPARALQGVATLGGRRTLHLFHITRLWRATVMAPVFAALPGPVILVLHSGSSLRQMESQPPWQEWLLRRSLLAYVRIWAVNDEIGSVLPAPVASRVRVVSPFVPALGLLPPQSPVQVRRTEPHLVTVATNAGLAHYNADLAVEAVRLVRADWPDARLWILAYGADGPHLERLRQSVTALDWVTVSFDLAPDEVAGALARSAVFLRPTDWDGDSMIVREALAVGARVVASDVCPRPSGVELSPLNVEALAAVIVDGGPVSSGEGLALRSILDFALEALDRLRPETEGDRD